MRRRVSARVGGGEVPDEVDIGAFVDECAQEVLGNLAVHRRPDAFDVSGLEHRLPGSALYVVFWIVASEHGMAHGADLQGALLVRGEDLLVMFGGADGLIAGDEIAVDRGNPVHSAFSTESFIDRERILIEFRDSHPIRHWRRGDCSVGVFVKT
jgi:hypothetical protein